MDIIITSADVYSAIDAERPVGSIVRIGGGAYRLTINDWGSTECPSYDNAVGVAGEVVDQREADPTYEVKKLQARIVVLESKLREVGVDVAIVAVPVDVKG